MLTLSKAILVIEAVDVWDALTKCAIAGRLNDQPAAAKAQAALQAYFKPLIATLG